MSAFEGNKGRPETKQELIEGAALKLFLRHGYRKVRMVEIAQECKMSRPPLYAVFPKKEAILAAITERYCRDNVVLCAQRLSTAKDLESRIRVIFEIWVIASHKLAMQSENARELALLASDVVPEAADRIWKTVEGEIIRVLELEKTRPGHSQVVEIAHTVAVAVRATKHDVRSLKDLERFLRGLTSLVLGSIPKRKPTVPRR